MTYTPQDKLQRVNDLQKLLSDQAFKNRKVGDEHPDPTTARWFKGFASGIEYADRLLRIALEDPTKDLDFPDEEVEQP